MDSPVLVKQALLRIEDLEAQLRDAEGRRGEPIAIVGVGCRFPSRIHTPEAFWEFLRAGGDAVREIPRSRWDVDRYYDPNPDAPGKMYCRHGAFLDDLDQFDPTFFGLSPREASAMDPQQRLLLECAWEALERAGVPPLSLRSSRTGVFVGSMSNEYVTLSVQRGDLDGLEAHVGTGAAGSFLAGRLSHQYGLMGPSVVVDAACASSLVAVHLACRSLRTGECDLALAGGVNAILSPEAWILTCKLRALAADGRCKTFDAAADGYGRGEGCGVIVLRRLSDAMNAGDNILAVLRGSAVNHNGMGGGLTVPNAQAQEQVIRSALADGNVDPREVGYVEAHGTGTPLGDPTELSALWSALGADRSGDRPLSVGSVKTNIGHLEGAAGIAGIIKSILVLQHAELPPHLHLRQLNPHIAEAKFPLSIPTQLTSWASKSPRIAGVSSFGLSGVNAHVIIEQAPARSQQSTAKKPKRSRQVLPLSAKSETALRGFAEQYALLLESDSKPALDDVCFTASIGRSPLPWRWSGIAESSREMADRLRELAAGTAKVEPPREAGKRPRIGFLFTGQGSQYAGMCQRLYEMEPVFRQFVDEAEPILADVLKRSFRGVLFGGGPAIDQTGLAQPALFVIEAALTKLWQNWGIEPDFVMGHSVGEFAAAYAAGVFSFEDGLRLIAERGRLMQSLPAGGGMLAVLADRHAVVPSLTPHRDLALAADNGAHVVVSGPNASLDRFANEMESRGISSQRLATSHAFHSELIEPILDRFEQFAADIEHQIPACSFISNRTGEPLAHGQALNAAYWRRHAREPVQFVLGLNALARFGVDVLLEIGPTPVLLGMAGRSWPKNAQAPAMIGSLRRNVADDVQLASAVAELHRVGVDVNFGAYCRGVAAQKIVLPTHPFQRERCWLESISSSSASPKRVETYATTWVELSDQPPGDSNGVRPHSWLTLANDDRMASALAKQLSEAMQPCAATRAPTSRADAQRLFEPADASLADIVLFANPSDRLEESAAGYLAVAQGLIDSGRKARLWLVTYGCQPVITGERVRPAGAAAWGIGKVFGLEYPELFGGMIDLPADADATDAADLASLLARHIDEDRLALRNGKTYVERLERRSAKEAASSFSVRPDRRYVVTGGFGGLGRHFARRLVELGVRDLLLIGRRDVEDPDRRDFVQSLHDLGAKVEVASVDIADIDALRSALSTGSPVAGVIHAAGVEAVQSFEKLSDVELRQAFAAKGLGAWNLHEVTNAQPLDFFVAVSSVAAVWGGRGQAHYAAANAYVDALIAERRALGLAGVTINYGPWTGANMATDAARDWLARGGLRALEPVAALESAERLIGENATQAVVADVDWDVFLPVYQARRSWRLFDRLRLASKRQPTGRTEFAKSLTSSGRKERRRSLVTHVRNRLAGVLRLDAARVEPTAAVFDLGVDSLLAVELKKLLESDLGVELPATLVLDYPSVESVANFLLSTLESAPIANGDARPAHSAVDVAEPIAIVGVSCRLPLADDVEQYWRVLIEGKDAIRPLSDGRWQASIRSADKEVLATGGYLDGVARFDAPFFGVSPREAAAMDPQQRIVLELAWEALEDAAIAPADLLGSQTGVFVGIRPNEYGALVAGSDEAFDPYFAAGNSQSVIAGRVAYVFGIQGPTIAIDTACSSSLVAVHQACTSLRLHECNLALAGGVNLLVSPISSLATSQAGMLSPDHRCKTFDASANGYVRGEGCAFVALKRLRDAERDGDRVLAVVRGSAVNHDGRSGGLTVPNGPAQERVIRDALAVAGIAPAEVSYVEAHGTGTSLGDPIEVRALANVYGEDRAGDRPLVVGSVKTNIGHLEAAAGIAGLVKVILAFDHAIIPKSLHFTAPNPHIEWDRISVRVAAEAKAWPVENGKPRLAGISSFGFSGTNAHVVVAEHPSLARTARKTGEESELLVLSAKTPAALSELAGRFVAALEYIGVDDWTDICYTAGVGRSHFRHRLSLTATSASLAARQLRAWRNGEASAVLVAEADRERPIGFYFGPLGNSAKNRIRDMIAKNSAFAERVSQALEDAEITGVGLDTLFVQSTPAVDVVVMTASANYWRDCGLEVSGVGGAGIGVLAAASFAGAIDLLTAARAANLLGDRDALQRLFATCGLQPTELESLTPGAPAPWSSGAAMLQALEALAPAMAIVDRDTWDIAVFGDIQSVQQNSTIEMLGSKSLSELATHFYLLGSRLNFTELYRGRSPRKVRLPFYPFERKEYWLAPAAGVSFNGVDVHWLLGQRQLAARTGDETFSGALAGPGREFLADHQVLGRTIVPAALYVASAVAAAPLPVQLDDVFFEQTAELSPNGPREFQLVLERAADSGHRRFNYFVVEENGWSRKASGGLSRADSSPPESVSFADELRDMTESSVAAMYERFQQIGITFGPSFRRIVRIYSGTTAALAEIEISEAMDDPKMPFHPTALDACLQTIAGFGASSEASGFYLPMRIERFDLWSPAPRRFWCRATIRESSDVGNETATADLALFDGNGSVFGSIAGFVLKRVETSATEPRRRVDPAELLYEITWPEKTRDDGPADYLPSAQVLVALIHAPKIAEDANIEAAIDALCRSYVIAAFSSLGWNPKAGDQATTDELARVLKISERHRRLLDRLLEHLVAGGILTSTGSGWRVAAWERSDVTTAERRLFADSPALQSELSLLVRCGRSLADVLSGNQLPLELMFPVGAASGAEAVYHESPVLEALNSIAKQTIEAAAKNIGADRRLRILEIGAGTGGTSARMLEALEPAKTQYVYTDLSAAFLAPAAERFRQYPFIEYRTLDIERPPTDQGFTAGSFDVVVAANVLHATRDLRATLNHVRQLLVPGGWLVLLEMMRPQMWMDLTFGLLDGWWRFDDQFRKHSALLSAAGWQAALSATGFEDCTVFSPTERESQAGLVARTSKKLATPADGRWLLVGAGGSLGRMLSEELRRRGADVHWQTDNLSADPASYGSAIGSSQLAGVIHLANLDLPDEPTDLASLRESLQLGTGSLLGLTQALIRAGSKPKNGVWVLTENAQAIGSESAIAPQQASAWGFSRVAELEHPELSCRRLDLDRTDDISASELDRILLDILRPDPNEDQFAYRNGVRHVARLTRAATPGIDWTASSSATYLITGGLGGLGLAAAEHLVQRGARNLVLMGRRNANLTAESMLAKLRSAGAAIEVVTGDVSSPEDIDRVLQSIARSGKPLAGIIHAAGLLDDGATVNQTWSRFESVLAPKAIGAWLLDQRMQNLPLDRFVMYSSLSSATGSAGQANYAAANAFLDALAQRRRLKGLAGQSINWGGWSEIGSAAGRPEVAARLHEAGGRLLTPAEGMAAFDAALARPDAQMIVAPFDWNRAGGIPLFSALSSRGQKRSSSGPARTAKRSRLQNVREGQRDRELQKILESEIVRLLRLDPDQAPRPTDRLFDVGLDSLIAVELRNRLQESLELTTPLPATLLFDYPTIDALVAHLSTLLDPESSRQASPREERSRSIGEDEIAIIGMACRFPGGRDPDSFWEFLKAGGDAVVDIPPDRWDIDAYYDPDPDALGKMYCRRIAAMPGVDEFDASFFGISPREAVTLDPQQRFLMETSWEALERAGIPPDGLAESRTGVFIGMLSSDFAHIVSASEGAGIEASIGTGTTSSVASGRISYFFGMQGPSIVVETACSSSLVAIHLAVFSLRAGESDLAIAGGSNAVVSPEMTIQECKARMLSPNGRCATFDAGADGFVRGDGCGVVVLKRLKDAERDGDPIVAIIRGSAVNQDGRSGGLTVPNGPAQVRVIRDALASGGLDPTDVAYVEAHGTGTSLGDPIEVRSLANAYGEGRSKDDPLLIGSVKTNVGHLEAAAGIVGVIKAALVLEHGMAPPSLHFNTPNSHIPWNELPVRVTSTATPLPRRGEQPHRAAISSFGFSGTNSHIILEEYRHPKRKGSTSARPERKWHVLTLSAKTPVALTQVANRYLDWLRVHPEASLADVCYSTNTGRASFDYRSAFSVDSTAALMEGLARLASQPGSIPDSVRGGPAVEVRFTEIGLPPAALVERMLETQPVLAKSLRRLDALGSGDIGKSIVEILLQKNAAATPVRWSMPARFAWNESLWSLWLSWGIRPSIVSGEGVAILNALVAAKAVDADDAFRWAIAWSRASQEETNADAERLAEARLMVKERLRHISLQAPIIRVVHTKSGRTMAAGEELAWHDVQRFVEGGTGHSHLAAPIDGPSVLLNVSNIEQSADGSPFDRRIADEAARMFLSGVTLDWRAFDAPFPRLKLVLPTYAFQSQRYWPTPARRRSISAEGEHPLLGAVQNVASIGDDIYTFPLSHKLFPFLPEHRVLGRPLAPGAMFMSIALSLCPAESCLRNLAIHEPLNVDDKDELMIQVVVSSSDDPGGQLFRVYSRPKAGGVPWKMHVETRIVSTDDSAPTSIALEALFARMAPALPEELYANLDAIGLNYGASFRLVDRLWRCDGEAVGRLTVPDGIARQTEWLPLHPCLLDACTHVLAAVASAGPATDDLYLPMHYERVTCHAPATRQVYCHVVRRTTDAAGDETRSFNLFVYDDTGIPVVRIEGLVVKRARRSDVLRRLQLPVDRLLHAVEWKAQSESTSIEGSASAVMTENWLIFAGDDSLARTSMERLSGRGSVFRASIGAEFAESSPHEFQVNARSPGDLARLIERIRETIGDARLHILYLWGLDATIPATDSEVVSEDNSIAKACGGLFHLAQALIGAACKVGGLWIVTRGGQSVDGIENVAPIQAMLWGLARGIRSEQPSLECRIRDLDPLSVEAPAAFWRDLGATEPALESAWRGELRYLPELKSVPKDPLIDSERNYVWTVEERGTIDRLFAKSIETVAPAPGHLLVRIRAAGVNFRDVLNVLGMYPGDPGPPGGEFAGEVIAIGPGVESFAIGDAVLGFGAGSLATVVQVAESLVIRKPAALSFAEAAAIPVVYGTAQMAFDAARLAAGETVLIHAGTGGLGQAAIHLARERGAKVMATASRGKWDLLRRQGIEHVYNSRSLDFADEILRDTNGRGVDVVLNSLAGPFIEATLKTMAPGGRFMEVGKRDLRSTAEFAAVRPDVEYRQIALDETLFATPGAASTLLGELSRRIGERKLTGPAVTIRPLSSAPATFRLMQQARHVGKLVLSPPPAELAKADATYLITGGVGLIGLATMEMLANYGARHFVLTRRSRSDTAVPAVVDSLRKRGCDVRIVSLDSADVVGVRKLFEEILPTMPPLRGVFHSAGQLDDGLIENLDWSRFQTVFAAKVAGSWLLHEFTKNLELDYFVLYSSAASLSAPAGQSNYSTANAFLDGLSYYRRSIGLPAQTVNWGAWDAGGLAAGADRARLLRLGVRSMRTVEAIDALAEVLRRGLPQTLVMDHVDDNSPATSKGSGSDAKKSSTAQQRHRLTLKPRLQSTPAGRRRIVVEEFLQNEVKTVLSLSSPPDRSLGFFQLGMDSLMAVELRNRIQGEIGRDADLSSSLIFDFPTIVDLANRLVQSLAKEFDFDEDSVAAAAPVAAAAESNGAESERALLDEISSLSDEEVAAQIAEELKQLEGDDA